jgi:hypothetical protein
VTGYIFLIDANRALELHPKTPQSGEETMRFSALSSGRFPNPRKLSLRKDSQHCNLCFEREFANLVEKNGPTISELEPDEPL